jgi:hypothetical protein
MTLPLNVVVGKKKREEKRRFCDSKVWPTFYGLPARKVTLTKKKHYSMQRAWLNKLPVTIYNTDRFIKARHMFWYRLLILFRIPRRTSTKFYFCDFMNAMNYR